MAFPCSVCGANFTRKVNRDQHVFNIHVNKNLVHICRWCGAVFQSVRQLRTHRLAHKPNTQFVLRQNATRDKCTVYRKDYATQVKTFEEAILQDKQELARVLSYEWLIRKSMKATIVYRANFARMEGDQEYIQPMSLRQKACTISQTGDVDNLISVTRTSIQQRIDDFIEHGE